MNYIFVIRIKFIAVLETTNLYYELQLFFHHSNSSGFSAEIDSFWIYGNILSILRNKSKLAGGYIFIFSLQILAFI